MHGTRAGRALVRLVAGTVRFDADCGFCTPVPTSRVGTAGSTDPATAVRVDLAERRPAPRPAMPTAHGGGLVTPPPRWPHAPVAPLSRGGARPACGAVPRVALAERWPPRSTARRSRPAGRRRLRGGGLAGAGSPRPGSSRRPAAPRCTPVLQVLGVPALDLADRRTRRRRMISPPLRGLVRRSTSPDRVRGRLGSPSPQPARAPTSPACRLRGRAHRASATRCGSAAYEPATAAPARRGGGRASCLGADHYFLDRRSAAPAPARRGGTTDRRGAAAARATRLSRA